MHLGTMHSSQQSKPTCPTMLLVRRRFAACLARTKSRHVLAPPILNSADEKRELGIWTRCWREFSMKSQLKEVKKGGTPVLDKSDSLTVGGGVRDVYGEDEASMDRLVTPWSRNVASGVELLRDPRYNKGLGFTEEERDQHYLRGLLPPIHMTQDHQEQRILYNIRLYSDNLLKYVSIMELQERNERLFYKVLIDHVEEMMPIVYTPTVGEACQKYGLIFRRPHGLYISLKERGRILDVLKNWPEKDVRIIVVTDGERILGLGDLGLQGMGIPIGKLALYTALGGIRPSVCLPVAIDVGTNNKQLLDDPFYIGLRRERATGQEYDDLVHEFMCAVKQEYGEKVLVQFEDFANHNAFKLLAKYITTHLVFNDDIQGTAAVTLAGLLAACKYTKSKLSDQTFLFSGAGEAGTGIAEIIALKISHEVNIPLEEARKKIWLTDSKGLIVKSRFDSLQTFKKPYAHEHEGCSELSHAVKILKPTILIGTSAQGGIFTRDVLETMPSYTQRPIIMALSNPTSKAECTAEQAFTWTQGRALFASGSPFQPVTYNNKKFFTSQANNAYVFPGIGLGCMISGAIRMRDEMFLIAAEALASQVTEDHLEKGLLYPPWGSIRTVSAQVAAAVSAAAYDLGVATRLPRPDDLFSYAKSCMYSPLYRQYR